MKYAREFAIVALVSALALWGTVQTLRVKAAQNRTQAVTLEYQQYKLDRQAQVQQIRADAYRQMEENHAKDQQQIQELQGKLVSTQATLADTNRDYGRVRSELARIRDAGNAATANDCQAAASIGVLLSDVFGECRQRLAEVAAGADQRGLAGAACERSYDTIREVVMGGFSISA